MLFWVKWINSEEQFLYILHECVCTQKCQCPYIRRWKVIENETVYKSPKQCQFPRWKKLAESIIFQGINFSQKTIRICSIIHNYTHLSIPQALLYLEKLNKLVETIWYRDCLKTTILADFHCHLKKNNNGLKIYV